MNKIEIYNSVNNILVNDDQKYDKLNPKGSDNLIEKINKIFTNQGNVEYITIWNAIYKNKRVLITLLFL